MDKINGWKINKSINLLNNQLYILLIAQCFIRLTGRCHIITIGKINKSKNRLNNQLCTLPRFFCFFCHLPPKCLHPCIFLKIFNKSMKPNGGNVLIHWFYPSFEQLSHNICRMQKEIPNKSNGPFFHSAFGIWQKMPTGRTFPRYPHSVFTCFVQSGFSTSVIAVAAGVPLFSCQAQRKTRVLTTC